MPRSLVLALPLLLGASMSCRNASPDKPADEGGSVPGATSEVKLSAEAIQHGAVRWAAAEVRNLAALIEVPGQLVPNEDRTARLGAPAQGNVLTVHVQAGDRVTRGQALVTLHSGEANTASADHVKAMADLNARRAAAAFARTARERAERLLAAKAIARQEVERAQVEDEVARAELARAEAEVTRTQSALARLGVSPVSGLMVLQSPIEGIVLSREAVPGAVVEAGSPLVTVSDPGTLWLDIAATEQAGGASLSRGTRLHFVVPAFPADTFEARIVSIGGALDPQTRTLPIRALVANPRGRLRSQMFATVWLEGGGRREGVAVPEGAVMLLDQRPVVFIAHPGAAGDSRFERRDVVTGPAFGGVTPILRGVQRGELVVMAGAWAVKSAFARSGTPPMAMP